MESHLCKDRDVGSGLRARVKWMSQVMYLQSSHEREFILYSPTLSVYTKVMTRGIHNIMFSVTPDVFSPIHLRINPVTMIRIALTALCNLIPI